MPVVRIISWNIFHFSTSRANPPAGKAHRLNIILDAVHPAGAARNFDIFIILETQTGKPAAYANVGNLAASGATGGLPATQQLLAALQGRHVGAGGAGNWEAVVPTYLTARSQAEAISVFFHTACVTLQGPLTDLGIVAGSPWRTVATQSGLGTFKGQTRFYTVPPVGGVEIFFPANPQRRPYKVDFVTVAGGGVAFSVAAHHSPKPQGPNNATAQHGTLQLAEIREITVNRAAPVIVVGDFNCCTMAGCGNGCYAHDFYSQTKLTGPGAVTYAHVEDALKVIHEAIDATTHAETAVAQAAAAALNVGNAVQVQLDAAATQAAANNVQAAINSAIVAHTRVVGALHVTVTNAAAAAANIGLAAMPGFGALPAAYVAAANNFRNLAIAGRNSALAMNNYYNAATTAFLQHYANAVQRCANTIDNPGGSAALAVLTGQSAQAAMNAVNTVNVPNAPSTALLAVPVPNAAALIAAANGVGGAVTLALAAAANGLGDVTLAKNARNAIRPVAESLYISHIQQELSSLKGSAARPAAYTNHAFDHILTIEANQVTNAHVLDLVPTVVTNYHAAFNAAMATGTFKAGFKYIAIWGKKGVSDHLPVQADVDL